MAVESSSIFFFDTLSDDTYVRAPFFDVNSFLSRPVDIFGDPAGWLPFLGISGREVDEKCEQSEVLAFDEVPDEPEEAIEFTIKEIGHVPSLQEYQSTGIDRHSWVKEEWTDSQARFPNFGIVSSKSTVNTSLPSKKNRWVLSRR